MRHTEQGLGTAICAIAAMVAAPAAAQAVERHRYDLPVQDLETALRAIARVSGDEILFDATAVANKQAAAVRGEMTAAEAVEAVLAGSGLSVRRHEGAILIGPRTGGAGSAPPQPAADASDIVVTGSRIRGATGPAPVIVTTRADI